MKLTSAQYRILRFMSLGWELIQFNAKPSYEPGSRYSKRQWRKEIKNPILLKYDRMGMGGPFRRRSFEILLANGLVKQYKDVHFDNTPIICTAITRVGLKAIDKARAENMNHFAAALQRSKTVI